MYKKVVLIISFLTIFILGWALKPTLAKNSKADPETPLPEQEGTYDVPGHPNMKMRVFVYRAKNNAHGKPVTTPTPTPSLNCTLSDPNSSAEDGKTGWHLDPSVTYRLNSSSVPSSVGGANLPAIATNSFGVWTSAISNNVTMINGVETTLTRARFDGQNIISWGRTSGSALATTYIWYYTDSGRVADVDTIMNKLYTWRWSGGDSTCAYPYSYDAQNILAHEIGHWFGLDDMYTDPYINNTMYGWGSTEEAKKDTLTTGDINPAASIYP